MVVEPPIMDDGRLEYYMFVPMLSTLYGRDAYPHRFLRVIPGKDERETLTFYDDPTDLSTLVVVETCDMGTFLQFTSYGYTPYAEAAMSGLPNGIDFGKYSDYLLSQATLRHYEARAKTLLEICESKKLSVVGRMSTTPSTSELIDELDGTLCMWEMLMNTGQLRPKDCLSFAPGRSNSFSIPYKRFESKFYALEERMGMSNFANLKYKVTSEKRTKLLNSFED